MVYEDIPIGDEDLVNIPIEILPGVALPSPAADFVFSRLAWIKSGQKEPFDVTLPSSFEFHDLATLAFLIANNETSAAADMVSNLLRTPSTLLPSATLACGNDNYTKSNPFRRQRRPKLGRCGNGLDDDAILGQGEKVGLLLKKKGFTFICQGQPPTQQASSFRGDSNICDSLFPMR